MQSAWTYKMIDQESSDVGALPGLMVEGEGNGALPFQGGGENHIMVAIGSWFFLGEAISSRRWIGIFLVACGVFFIARPVARAEEKL